MSSISFLKAEVTSAIARGVQQCVVIGSRLPFIEISNGGRADHLQMFAVDEEKKSVEAASFVRTHFGSESLASALDNSAFDKFKSSLFVWLGGAGYRTVETAVMSLGFIASLPKGSGVVLDYKVERTSVGPSSHTALDALASRISIGGGRIKYLVQPQAVAAMLRSVGFRHIAEAAQDGFDTPGRRLVSAVI